MADRVPLDLDPPVRVLQALLLGIDDGELSAPTPCPDWTVAALLDHLCGLSYAFTLAARKRVDAASLTDVPSEPSAQHLSRHWRSRLPGLLEDLATAWQDPTAWTGTSQVDGVTMPAAEVGVVATNELIMHGWDLARATGQDFAADPRTLEILIGFMSQGSAEGTPGMFDPVVPTDGEATLLDEAVAMAGRDPAWRPPRRRQAAA